MDNAGSMYVWIGTGTLAIVAVGLAYVGGMESGMAIDLGIAAAGSLVMLVYWIRRTFFGER